MNDISGNNKQSPAQGTILAQKKKKKEQLNKEGGVLLFNNLSYKQIIPILKVYMKYLTPLTKLGGKMLRRKNHGNYTSSWASMMKF